MPELCDQAIKWDKIFYEVEPPLLRGKSNADIEAFRETPLTLSIVSNTQFLERLVQTVSKFGSVSTDASIRDGYAKATLEVQRKMPRRETKADFSCIAE